MPPAPAASPRSALRALAAANARYWPTVAPIVRRELRHWTQRAEVIPTARWRTIAREKIASEKFNAEVAATLATLAPFHLRRTVVRAIVAVEVMYDYLDGASEHASVTGAGDHLYDAFPAVLGNLTITTQHLYQGLTHDDGGYLDLLVTTSRAAFLRLPAAATVAPAALHAATRCAEAQTHTHLIAHHGTEPVRRWSTPAADELDLEWWEYAAGGAASVLAVHALIAAAADDRTTPATAAAIGHAYLLTCTLSTLLDSLVDRDRDRHENGHSYISYYANEDAAATRLATIARRAATATGRLPNGAHHLMTVAGVAGYYLSDPGARQPPARTTTARVKAELTPTLTPILAIFGTWRAAKRVRDAIGSGA
ncbi:hypothetical protein Cwoe_4469 [Conexibacter woesei DSM 14684]|uniref:Uncharacterized protein n=2 Tax=Conexibacter TaxID=191494 RepID=D3F7Y8_CONWI|nr:hypothetical protein Cwoe_4469 [Conexibacter woesei DSM 14684]